MSKIMIAVDFSSYSTSVVAAGMELAKSTKSSVVLLSILDKVGELIPSIEGGSASSEEWENRVQDVATRLSVIAESYDDISVSVSAIIGDPKKDILEQTIEQDIQTLVVGTHGRTGLDHLLVGSTAEFVIRHSTIPVLVVPYKQTKH
ncbi:Nucleotide-binding universal stress protein, UspA family [Chitinophaga sp. CF118]|uniref:universal stress protein n=1 Tax=Chitinophaga sp. CF118 TaxID=1884367 RepID=UPI0008F264E0|nr:universal stress protein [Chitinophaga sp. CF118]SFE78128.1 Nucleotide-binding universal stress protein, UspA family [Chitinophaga sp. CF118]